MVYAWLLSLCEFFIYSILSSLVFYIFGVVGSVLYI